MGFARNFGDHLAVKSHAALESANLGQQPVVMTFPAAQPSTVKRESYSGHQRKVQLVRGEDRTGRSRFGNPEWARLQNAIRLSHSTGKVNVPFHGVAGQGYDFSGMQGVFEQRANIRLETARRKKQNGAGFPPDRLRQHGLADLF